MRLGYVELLAEGAESPRALTLSFLSLILWRDTAVGLDVAAVGDEARHDVEALVALLPGAVPADGRPGRQRGG